MTRPEATNINTVEENGGTNELNNMEHLPLLVEQHAVPMIAHPDAQTEPLKKARAQGIVVVATNTDHPDGNASKTRDSYIGQNFVEAGMVIANYVVENGDLKEGDHCVVPGVSPEQWHIAARGEGVLKGLEANGITGEIIRSGEKEEGASRASKERRRITQES